jgi:3-oxoacyl-[acyl-carrier protein] reductase
MSNSGTESFDNTEDITEAAFDHVYSLNARAQFFIGQAAWNHLEDNGRLILMSSISAGKLGVKRHALYNSSKMAVIGMVKAFATDFGKRGITVNGIAPGGVLSDMFYQNCWNYIPGEIQSMEGMRLGSSCADEGDVGATPDWPPQKLEELTAKACPLGRCAVPEDIARVVAFLASEDGGWVNGKYRCPLV